MTNSSDESRWFVGFVKSCCERKAAEFLRSKFIECYVPVKREIRRWSDRNKLVDRILLPRLIFVHCDEATRLESLKSNPYLYAYMSELGKPVRVPDSQMKAFIAMVEQTDRELVASQNIAPGDKVRVLSGPFEGFQMEVVAVSGQKCYAVRLGVAGTFTMAVDTDTLRKIKD